MAYFLSPTNPRPSYKVLDPVGGWDTLVAGIRRDEPEAVAELYRIFALSIRYKFAGALGADHLEDRIHDTFLVIWDEVRKHLRDATRLPAYVAMIVKRQRFEYYAHSVKERTRSLDLSPATPADAAGPYQLLLVRERTDLMHAMLRQMRPREREVLKRFYLRDETKEQVISGMHFRSEKAFSLFKSDAKLKLTSMVKDRILSDSLKRTPITA